MFNIIYPSYDNDLSQIFFESFIDEIERVGGLLFNSNRGGIDYIVIGDCNKPFYTKTALRSMKKADLLELNYHYGVGLNEYYTKKELINELHSYITTGMHFTKEYENKGWHNLEYDFIARGYSQGDAVKVLHLCDAEREYSKEGIENLLYDTPIFSGVIGFLDQEVCLDDYAESYYNWCKVSLLRNFEERYKGWYKQRLIDIIKSLPDPKH